MEKITLTKEADGWYSDFVDDEEIMDLFGTTKIKTPFPVSLEVKEVTAKVAALNPGYEIIY